MSAARPWAGVKRRVAGLIVVVLGLALAAVHAAHLASEVPHEVEAAVLGALWPLLLALGLVAAGAWVASRERSAELALRTASWVVAGFATFIAMTAVFILYQLLEGATLSDPVFLVLNGGTIGATVGFLVGRYNARIVRHGRQLDALFADLPFPVSRYEVVDDETVLREVNPAFESTFEFAAAAVEGRRVGELGIAVDGLDVDPAALVHGTESADDAGGGPPPLELRLRTARGIREFEVYFIPYDIGGPNPTGFAVAVDVADRKRQLQRLQVLNRVLRHDLRNSANIVAGYATLLAEDGDDTTAHRATVIRENAEEMAELGERVRALEVDVERSAETHHVDLGALLRDQVAALRRDYPDAVVVEDLAVDGPGITASRLLDVAVGNVLENAVEHNPAPEPEVELTVHLSEEFVTIRVADDGPGLPDRELAALHRGSETPLSHTSGLGLWLSRWIVEDSGGELEIDERSIGGTEVTITLPLPSEQGADPSDDDPSDDGGSR